MMVAQKNLSSLLLTLLLAGLLSNTSAKPMSQLTFEKHSPLVQTSVGQSVVLHCKAEGSPSPVLYWERNGKRIPQEGNDLLIPDDKFTGTYEDNGAVVISKGTHKGNTLKMSSTMSRLYLDCITPEDEGEYTCVAVTPNQVLRTTTEVSVEPAESRHSCIEQRRKNGVVSVSTPRIHMWTVSRLEYEGSTVQLYCRVSGQPGTRVIWVDPRDNVIKNDNQYQLLKNGDLLITDVKWSLNMGFYRCIAEDKNSKTSDEASVFLYPIAS